MSEFGFYSWLLATCNFGDLLTFAQNERYIREAALFLHLKQDEVSRALQNAILTASRIQFEKAGDNPEYEQILKETLEFCLSRQMTSILSLI